MKIRPYQNYRVSLAIWEHTMLLAPETNESTLPYPQPVKAGTRFTYFGGMEGWVDLGAW